MLSFCLFFFFFQAEDGIRDLTVTGVQTCALPISEPTPGPTPQPTSSPTPEPTPGPISVPTASPVPLPTASPEIGRASCRERGVDLGGRRIIKKKKKTKKQHIDN